MDIFHLSTHLNEIPIGTSDYMILSYSTDMLKKICMLILYLIQQSINQSNFIHKVLNTIRGLFGYTWDCKLFKNNHNNNNIIIIIIQPFFVSSGNFKPLL